MIHARKDYMRIQDLSAVVKMLNKEYFGDEVCLRQIVSLLEAKYGPLEEVEPIPEDELVFLLRAKDIVAPSVVRVWATSAYGAGADDKMTAAARAHADSMEKYQDLHGFQVPDMPEDAVKHKGPCLGNAGDHY